MKSKHLDGASIVLFITILAFAACTPLVAPNYYSVSYSSNGVETGSPPVDPGNYQSGDSVTVLGQGSLTKAGYTFTGWNTAANGLGTDRAAGSTFTMGNADVILYAVWTQNPTYTVAYNANTGSGTPPIDGNNYHAGDTVTVLDKGNLVKAGYTFAGWNTAANGLGSDRAAGSTFTIGNADVILYAAWTPVQTATITVTFEISYQQVVFANTSVVTSQGDLLELSTTNTSLASQGTSWVWRMDGTTLTGQATSTLSLDMTNVSIGNHTIDLFVVYNGVLYSGNVLLTVTP
jgi:uncharacterized repeat protein (TIGR02543 family)